MFAQDQHMKVSPSSGQSILEMLERVMQQVEYHCFSKLHIKWIDPLYKELCLVIAEVLVLNPDSTVKINGSNMYTHLVQEVYSQLNNDHVRLVFENFNNVSTHVYNKKAYLRTALYNAVFEFQSHNINEINCV